VARVSGAEYTTSCDQKRRVATSCAESYVALIAQLVRRPVIALYRSVLSFVGRPQRSSVATQLHRLQLLLLLLRSDNPHQ